MYRQFAGRPGFMRQMITNLLQNAMNALLVKQDKGAKIDIHLGNENDDFVMRISDNGPGFPKC